MSIEISIREAAKVLRPARRVLAITGAGISADSGLPTYRGIGGLYEEELTEDEVPIEVALSGQMLREKPAITWKYLSQIERSCRNARHNAGHAALASMARCFERLTVLTQNIDGFHRDAGQSDLIEIHGNFRELYCAECGLDWRVVDYSGLSMPPRCEHCRGPVRPRVVLFGEMLPELALAKLYASIEDGVDAVLSIGTTSVFPYISGPVEQAARIGLPTIEINPTDSEVSKIVSHRIKACAAEVLPALLKELERP